MYNLYRIKSGELRNGQSRKSDFADLEFVDSVESFSELESRLEDHFYDDLDFENAFWEFS